jgi:hypothetical protein
MFSVLKFFYVLWRAGWGILNPNLNPMRNAPMYAKYFATILLGCFWSLAFCLYTAQFFIIGLNMLAHIAVISMVFITWATFKGFKRGYPDAYPLMRDPNFSPKCYEMTDAEKQVAMGHVDRLHKNQSENTKSEIQM